jgi:hypothetical protein
MMPEKNFDRETEKFLEEAFDARFSTKQPKRHLDLLTQRNTAVDELHKKIKGQNKRRRKKPQAKK